MSVVLRILLLCLCVVPHGADAGAWPRETGHWFIASSVRLGWPQNIAAWTSAAPAEQYNTLYVEYGLSPRLTLGLDLGRAVSGRSKSIAFVQVPLRARDGGPRIAAQIGLGEVAGETVFRPGLSLGWGLERGWLSVDSVVEFGLSRARPDWKVDVTWGRNLARGRKLIVQVQTGETRGDPPFARLAPSLVRPINDRLMLETGASIGLLGDSSMGVTLGLWAQF